MLAVKLHRKERPWLGTGSHLVPIFNWDVGYVHVKKWIKLLNNQNRGRPNHYIRYMTQVRIPDNLGVGLFRDWFHSYAPKAFKRWENIDQEKKQEIAEYWDNPPGTFDFDHHRFSKDGGPDYPFPEIVLGEPLPEDRILWTKDLFLLYKE